jgi:SIR2-like domain
LGRVLQPPSRISFRTLQKGLFNGLRRLGGGTHFVYDILANWPFPCYLTTNWDNEIDKRLRAIKIFFKTIQNSKDDFATIRHDSSHLIVKLHSDLDHPDRAVITSGDYAKLTGQEGQYFRDRLKAIFEMFDVFIVGHSLSDPDLRLILQVAKETASPEHPVFMITTGVTKAEELELLERFNVVTFGYDNSDGHHGQLRRVLSLIDKFVIPRQKRIDLKAFAFSPEELEAAQAVALYRRLCCTHPTCSPDSLFSCQGDFPALCEEWSTWGAAAR